MASSEWAVRCSIWVNCKPHRYSCTTVALWDSPGPMSRTWPRVGTACPWRRSQARSRLMVAGEEQVRKARSSTVSSAPCTLAWRARRASRPWRIAASPLPCNTPTSSRAASSRRTCTLRQAVIGLPRGFLGVNGQVAQLAWVGRDLAVLGEVAGHLLVVGPREHRSEVEVLTDPGHDRRLGVLGRQAGRPVAVHAPPPQGISRPRRVGLIRAQSEELRIEVAAELRECGQSVGWLWSNDTVVAVVGDPGASRHHPAACHLGRAPARPGHPPAYRARPRRRLPRRRALCG